MTEELQTPLLHISVAPHIRQNDSVPVVMRTVLIALIPAFIASIVFFGVHALFLVGVCVLFSVLTEWVIVRYAFKKPSTIGNYSAVITGVLLAFTLPPKLSLWIAAIGAIFSIAVAKMAFGGLGNTIVNPALAGRAFLFAAYPVSMTTWMATQFGSFNGLTQQIDALTNATPLMTIKTAMHAGEFQALDFQDALWSLFWGNVGGSLGETSAFAILIGALFILYRRIINLRIPFFFIGTVFILFWIFNGKTGDIFSTEALVIPFFQVLSGGLFLGAFFMATDTVTSPITPLGKIIFGVGCGLLTFAIRKFSSYPEGVCYAILLMNLVVGLLDRYTRPRIFGKGVPHA
jgi:electron transport complex protein RnfD